MPRYLIAFNDEWVPEHTPDELRRNGTASQAVLDEMRSAGVFVFAEGGIDASTAICSAVNRDGQPVFTDGPYVETKEHLGGFTVVDVADAAPHATGQAGSQSCWTGRRSCTGSHPVSRRSSTVAGRVARSEARRVDPLIRITSRSGADLAPVAHECHPRAF